MGTQLRDNQLDLESHIVHLDWDQTTPGSSAYNRVLQIWVDLFNSIRRKTVSITGDEGSPTQYMEELSNKQSHTHTHEKRKKRKEKEPLCTFAKLWI